MHCTSNAAFHFQVPSFIPQVPQPYVYFTSWHFVSHELTNHQTGLKQVNMSVTKAAPITQPNKCDHTSDCSDLSNSLKSYIKGVLFNGFHDILLLIAQLSLPSRFGFFLRWEPLLSLDVGFKWNSCAAPRWWNSEVTEEMFKMSTTVTVRLCGEIWEKISFKILIAHMDWTYAIIIGLIKYTLPQDNVTCLMKNVIYKT